MNDANGKSSNTKYSDPNGGEFNGDLPWYGP